MNGISRHVLLVMLFALYGSVLSAQIKVTGATGTGHTTGHIATISVHNTSGTAEVIPPMTFYIPSNGRHQDYVGRVPRGIVVPPGETVQIPVSGYCTDVHKPPVSSGEPMVPFDQWIPVSPSPDARPIPGLLPQDFDPRVPVRATVPEVEKAVPFTVHDPLPSFTPEDIPGITESPGFIPHIPTDPFKPYAIGPVPLVPTWPGTDIPVEGRIQPKDAADYVAPLIVRVVEEIETAADIILTAGTHPTPFSSTPERERETIIQQTIWITMGVLKGEPYGDEDFAARTYEQFEESTGIAVTRLPEEDKAELDSGITSFWRTFTAVGVEAKVLKEPEQPAIPISGPGTVSHPPPPEAAPNNCDIEEEIHDTGPKLDYAIARTGTRELNERVMEAFQAAIEQAYGKFTDAEGSDTVEVNFTNPEMPASAYSLYFPHAVAGRANAQAMHVDLQNLGGSAWTTEPISTSSDGERTVILRHITGDNCTSTLIGTNLARVRASSYVGATMSNPEILQIINFVGELAIDFLIQRGKGTVKKLSTYLKEKVKGLAGDAAKDLIKEELEKLADEMAGKTEEEIEQSMDELIKDIQAGEGEDDGGDWIYDWLAELIVEGEDINPVDKIISDLIPSPIDFAPIKTNTYAIAEGALDIWVDELHGQAKSASGVQYRRQAFESNEEAVRGGGTFCGQSLRTKTTSGQITLKTRGEVSTQAAATGEGLISTGHGRATSTLESFNGHYVIAICECPDGIYYHFYVSTTSLTGDEFMGPLWGKVFENVMHEVLDRLKSDLAALPRGRMALPSDYAGKLEDRMKQAADQAARSILRCP